MPRALTNGRCCKEDASDNDLPSSVTVLIRASPSEALTQVLTYFPLWVLDSFQYCLIIIYIYFIMRGIHFSKFFYSLILV